MSCNVSSLSVLTALADSTGTAGGVATMEMTPGRLGTGKSPTDLTNGLTTDLATVHATTAGVSVTAVNSVVDPSHVTSDFWTWANVRIMIIGLMIFLVTL